MTRCALMWLVLPALRPPRYALLGQLRNHLAAAFFLLGDSLSDAVSAITRSESADYALALLVCRLTHMRASSGGGGAGHFAPDLGDVGKQLVEGTMLAAARQQGDTWQQVGQARDGGRFLVSGSGLLVGCSKRGGVGVRLTCGICCCANT